MQENQQATRAAHPPSFQAAREAPDGRFTATIAGPMKTPHPPLRLLHVVPVGLAAAAGCTACAVARADCIDDAARHHGVNAHVLRAIGWHESRLRPDAVAVNANGTRDLGAFQINTTHLPRLARHGVTAASLHDGCTSAFVAAWHYARQVARFGNTWQAVGAYHSLTPPRTAGYANAIAAVLVRWRLRPAGPPPFDPAHAVAPGATRAPASSAPPRVATGPLFDDGDTPAP